MAFASRFLNAAVESHSISELEIIDVVWSNEHFKYYLCGKTLKVITTAEPYAQSWAKTELINHIIVVSEV